MSEVMQKGSNDHSGTEGVVGERLAPSRSRAALTSRDREILQDLADFRYLTTSQLARLHFGSLKVAQRRMRRLFTMGAVARVPTEAGVRAGFHDWTYAVRPKHAPEPAVENARQSLHAPVRGLGIRYAAHHRLVVDVRIWLREAVARPGGFTCRLVPGYAEVRTEGRRHRLVAMEVDPDGRILVPDAAFELRRADGRAALFFLEVDRGTEPLRGKHPSSILRKLAGYRAIYDTGLFRRFSEFFEHDFSGFRVLFVAMDEVRITSALQLAEEADLAPLLWATTTASLRSTGVLSASIWRDQAAGTPRSLLE